MNSRITLLVISIFSLTFTYTPKLMAHAGVDHGDNCFVHLAGLELRLGGFQAESKIGSGKHFCHLFPATGDVIFTFDPHSDMLLNNKKLNLKLLSAESYWDVLFDFDNAFKQTISQADNAFTISHTFPTPGLYAMQISLQSDELEPSINNSQRFLFIVGFPIIKILVLVGFGFLLVIAFVLFKQLRAGVNQK
ncbi:MAG TPA: hypothetical protein EYQ43_01085 [Methyloprofundus sp.]|uniref:hypothetical protein n=1 Tax=Methyloprofundus sp. TaxID=2020875 RepID=UPI0017D18F77|nr:hypothetical protein [Methyloprofundus sp.]HIG64190.1 hypothetical protein [Methyloprofundus sp.]HIL78647.1 hypothetical protein [Methylococcales bacterium]